MPSCYCLVPDASGTRVLLESGPEGWTLPTVEHADGWFAHEAVAVARQLSDRLGIKLVALREVEEAGLHLCELENLSPEWSPGSGWRWVDRAAAAAVHLKAARPAGPAARLVPAGQPPAAARGEVPLGEEGLVRRGGRLD